MKIKIKPLTVKLNKKQLQRDVFVGGEKIIKSLIAPIIEAKIAKEQAQMVDDFDDHPISQEIWAGNSAENTSGTLGGYGNLFSFIGFKEGSDPISPISLILRGKITHTIKRTNDHGGYIVTINIPDKKELHGKAQVDWMGGRSWLDGIEHGIAGLNRFLYDEEGYGSPKPSLSETGIQAKHNIRNSVSYKNVSYVSKILNDFRKRLTRLI